jgi:hypothetical protein
MGRTIKILVAIALLGALSYVANDQIGTWYKRRLEISLEQGQEEWQKKTEDLKAKIAELQEEQEQQGNALVPEERLLEVFGEEASVVLPEKKEISCKELEHQITSFFNYLDKKRYREICELEEETHDVFQQVVAQLSERPPMVTGEMKGISTLIRNMAHFYRVLGRKRVELIKEIVKNESEVMETIMATFFTLFTSGDRCEELIKDSPSPEVLYEYASFFLNTLAGKSYLLRRDSKMRILTSYYCVLILDKANDETLNKYGIDIRPHIDFLSQDMGNQKGLAYKRQYLEKLTSLKKKYQL